MLTRSEIKKYLELDPRFADMICSLQAISKQPKAMARETEEVVALARRFNDQVVRPGVAELDRRMQADPDFLPYEFIAEANRWGLYTLWVPKIFGGRGYNLPSLSYFVEEIASACVAMANLIGVHYLGVGALIASWNTPIIQRVFDEVLSQGQEIAHSLPCQFGLRLWQTIVVDGCAIAGGGRSQIVHHGPARPVVKTCC